MNKDKIKNLKYTTLLILDIIILIFALILLIFYKGNIIKEYTAILLSLICLISTELTSILRKRIRENKKR